MTADAAFDNVQAPGGGRIGLVHCPGTQAFGLGPAEQTRLIDLDLATCRQWGARALVTLMEHHELTLLGVERLGERARAAGLDWWHLPMVDGGAPDVRFEERWVDAGPALHAILDADGRILLHCRAGMGRSGTVAARLMVERGMPADRAVTAVRRARPGAIENTEQLVWLREFGAR